VGKLCIVIMNGSNATYQPIPALESGRINQWLKLTKLGATDLSAYI